METSFWMFCWWIPTRSSELISFFFRIRISELIGLWLIFTTDISFLTRHTHHVWPSYPTIRWAPSTYERYQNIDQRADRVKTDSQAKANQPITLVKITCPRSVCFPERLAVTLLFPLASGNRTYDSSRWSRVQYYIWLWLCNGDSSLGAFVKIRTMQ